MPRRSPAAPLPIEALRDLIGICRALYAAGHAGGASASELEHLHYIGKMLTEAHELGHDAKPYSKRYNDAWTRAEEGTLALGFLVDAELRLRPALEAAARRVTGNALPKAEPGPKRVRRG